MGVMDKMMSRDGGVSKHRVSKACDRCRLKKSKCDGQNPCNRCKLENQVCLFGERRKSKDKTYPKGYVELLEHQQSLLVVALRQLYQKPRKQPSVTEENGVPRVHDMLESLGILRSEHEHSDSSVSTDGFQFEEEPMKMQWSLDEANKSAELASFRISPPRFAIPSKPSQRSEFANMIASSAPSDGYNSFSPEMLSSTLDAVPDTMQYAQSPDSESATEIDAETVGDIDPKVRAAIDYLRSKSAREQASAIDFSYPFNMLYTDQEGFMDTLQEGSFLNSEAFY